MTERRAEVAEAAIVAVYRHARNEATSAAMSQDWPECHRLSSIARSIARAYPQAAEKARFTSASACHRPSK